MLVPFCPCVLLVPTPTLIIKVKPGVEGAAEMFHLQAGCCSDPWGLAGGVTAPAVHAVLCVGFRKHCRGRGARGRARCHLRPMETGGRAWAGQGRCRGEDGGAEQFNRTEGRAARNEVHLVFVRAREEGESFGFTRPTGKETLSLDVFICFISVWFYTKYTIIHLTENEQIRFTIDYIYFRYTPLFCKKGERGVCESLSYR